MPGLYSKLDEFTRIERTASRGLGGEQKDPAPRAEGESRWNGFSNATIHIVSTGKYRRTGVALE